MAKKRNTSKKYNRVSRSSGRRLIYYVVAIVVLIVVGVGIYEIRHRPPATVDTSLSNDTKLPPASTVHTTTNTPAPNTVITNPAPTPTTNVPGGQTGSNVTSTATLTAPSGTFVSNHGSADQPVSPNTEEASTCITTPGASCSIEFTKGGTTESLGASAASSSGKDGQNGTVTWSWTPASLSLSTGVWRVTAVATLNGQTQTTQDPTPLTVQ